MFNKRVHSQNTKMISKKAGLDIASNCGFLILALALILAPAAAAQHYQQNNLVSDVKGLATTTDPNLVNAWGLARSQTSPWWVPTTVPESRRCMTEREPRDH